MDTKDKNQSSNDIVRVSRDEALKIAEKIFRHAISKTDFLLQHNPYWIFYIVNNPGLYTKYKKELDYYDKIYAHYLNLYEKLLLNSDIEIVNIPKSLIKYSENIEHISDNDYESYLGRVLENSLKMLELNPHDLISAEVLNDYIATRRKDVLSDVLSDEKWAECFNLLKDNEVIKKYLKNKKKGHLPSSFEEYRTLEKKLPSTLINYIKTTIERDYKKKGYRALTNSYEELQEKDLNRNEFKDDTEINDLESKYSAHEEKIKVNEAKQSLTPKEQEVIELRYNSDSGIPTQEEVAEKLGISQKRVSELEKKAKQKLKKHLDVLRKPKKTAIRS